MKVGSLYSYANNTAIMIVIKKMPDGNWMVVNDQGRIFHKMLERNFQYCQLLAL